METVPYSIRISSMHPSNQIGNYIEDISLISYGTGSLGSRTHSADSALIDSHQSAHGVTLYDVIFAICLGASTPLM